MLYSKIIPNMTGEFIRWLNNEEFILLICEQEMIGHKDYWWGLEEYL